MWEVNLFSRKDFVAKTDKQRFCEIIKNLAKAHPFIAKAYRDANVIKCNKNGVAIALNLTQRYAQSYGPFGVTSISRLRAEIATYFQQFGIPLSIQANFE